MKDSWNFSDYWKPVISLITRRSRVRNPPHYSFVRKFRGHSRPPSERRSCRLVNGTDVFDLRVDRGRADRRPGLRGDRVPTERRVMPGMPCVAGRSRLSSARALPVRLPPDSRLFSRCCPAWRPRRCRKRGRFAGRAARSLRRSAGPRHCDARRPLRRANRSV